MLPAPHLPDWLENELPFRRYATQIGGYKMHVMEAGSATGRPVFMLHGNPTWGFLWRKVARELSTEPLRLIMPDLIGFGLSDKPRDLAAHSLLNHSAWIGELIDQLELRDLIFVGQDWGGPIGLHALSSHRDRVAGLVILNTSVGPPREGFRPTWFHRFARMPVVSDIAFRLLGFPQNNLGAVQGDPKSMSGLVGRAYRYPFRKISDRVAPLATARMVPNSQNHVSIAPLQTCADFVASFTGPTEIVWGMRDPVLGRALSRNQQFMNHPPTVETKAGHFLQEEVPDVIADAIRRVVSRVATE